MTREDWRQAHKLINIMVEANQVNDDRNIWNSKLWFNLEKLVDGGNCGKQKPVTAAKEKQ